MSLTEDEREVVETIVSAYKKFLALPQYHPSEVHKPMTQKEGWDQDFKNQRETGEFSDTLSDPRTVNDSSTADKPAVEPHSR